MQHTSLSEESTFFSYLTEVGSCWVLLVRGALFCIIRHIPSESPRKGLPPSATRRTRLNAVVPQREVDLLTYAWRQNSVTMKKWYP